MAHVDKLTSLITHARMQKWNATLMSDLHFNDGHNQHLHDQTVEQPQQSLVLWVEEFRLFNGGEWEYYLTVYMLRIGLRRKPGMWKGTRLLE